KRIIPIGWIDLGNIRPISLGADESMFNGWGHLFSAPGMRGILINYACHRKPVAHGRTAHSEKLSNGRWRKQIDVTWLYRIIARCQNLRPGIVRLTVERRPHHDDGRDRRWE